tara:strand:+ start:105 stop:959 length:855 start_codon:yes stop_codon:yes gene_type:complete
VIDGDTIVLNGEKIRFNGIDAPELNQTCVREVKRTQCGVKAKEILLKKIGNSKLDCIKQGKDRYNRTLGECFVRGESLSRFLVKRGYAFAYRNYSEKFIDEEEFAKKNNLGVWSSTFQYPWDFRKTIRALKKGKKIIFIRHALAPGSGDPDIFNLDDCSTQRNLNNIGVTQSKEIGKFFISNKIGIDEVLSSEWCRCKDTAKYAFGNFRSFNGLNSFYQKRFYKFKEKQIKDLKELINNWKNDNNLILVTHYVVILEMLDITTSSGEIIITDKNLNIISKIETL